jgi:cytochrome c-type biogenesis protein CcmF
MIAELGHFALALALCVALAMAIVPLVGAARGDARWMAFARPAAGAQFLLVAIAFGALAWSFVQNDFSVAYVAQHSNSKLPLQYRLSAVWGGHEGSLLLWILMLAAGRSRLRLHRARCPKRSSRARSACSASSPPASMRSSSLHRTRSSGSRACRPTGAT